MSRLWIPALAALVATGSQVASTKVDHAPHVVMILGDDIGWANVGWNRQVPTDEVQVSPSDSSLPMRLKLANGTMPTRE